MHTQPQSVFAYKLHRPTCIHGYLTTVVTSLHSCEQLPCVNNEVQTADELSSS